MRTYQTLDYAHGRMKGAASFHVIDLKTGERVLNVVEANAKEGWRRQFETVAGIPRRGPDGKFLTVRVDGPIEIRQPTEDPELVQSRLQKAEAKRARKAALRK